MNPYKLDFFLPTLFKELGGDCSHENPRPCNILVVKSVK